MNPHDVAAELRARAERARVKADELPVSSVRTAVIARATALDDAASLVESTARVDPRIGLTVIAQTGDGPLRGRIESIDGDNVQMQVGESWWECVSPACLYADEPVPTDSSQRKEYIMTETTIEIPKELLNEAAKNEIKRLSHELDLALKREKRAKARVAELEADRKLVSSTLDEIRSFVDGLVWDLGMDGDYDRA